MRGRKGWQPGRNQPGRISRDSKTIELTRKIIAVAKEGCNYFINKTK